MNVGLRTCVALAFLVFAPAAWAQDKPEGLLKTEAASSGKTDVEKTGFEAVAAKPEQEQDATELSLSLGGVLASGNSRSFSATTVGDFRLRRRSHQFGMALSGNYGRSAPDPDSSTETTVENIQGRVRYDEFVTDGLAVFLAVSGRRDRFQGLNLRLNVDPGVAIYLVDQKTQQFWTEVGYDLQHDIRDDDAIAAAAAGGNPPIDKSETRHNARLFLGYKNKLNSTVGLFTGLEYLQGLSPFEDDQSKRINWRLNWDGAVTTSVSDRFSFATTMSVKYDNNPLPGVRKTDTVTSLNLVYNLL